MWGFHTKCVKLGRSEFECTVILNLFRPELKQKHCSSKTSYYTHKAC